jgi:hypothetical protein
VIAEHSNERDWVDLKTGYPIRLETVVYQRVELSARKTAELVAIASTLGAREEFRSACAPRPHYTLFFYYRGAEVDQIEVCFECGTVLWFGLGPPMEFFPRLESLVQSLGMQPRGNWRERAQAYRK